MAISSIAPLKGARVRLSGSIPDAADGVDSGSLAAFVAEISEKSFAPAARSSMAAVRRSGRSSWIRPGNFKKSTDRRTA